MRARRTPIHSTLTIRDLQVEVVRKEIKNLHLSVHPPDGRVRISAPFRIDDDTIRRAVATRLGWIQRKQRALTGQERQSTREMVSGESHFVAGRRYRLDVIEAPGRARVTIRTTTTLELRVPPGSTRDQREAVLSTWYRNQLREQIPLLIAKWEPVLGVSVADWGIKRMKTRWGTCNITARRIWLNLELAKKPPACLEYVVVHEMAHLLERHHNDRFRGHLDRVLPNWRAIQTELNQGPLTEKEDEVDDPD